MTITVGCINSHYYRSIANDISATIKGIVTLSLKGVRVPSLWSYHLQRAAANKKGTQEYNVEFTFISLNYPS